VAGTSFESRARDFLLLAPTADFRLALEAEPDNPVSPLARKVVASGTLDGQHVTRQIGYLPDSLATRYADAELDVRPHRVFVPPTADLSLGIEIAVLIRKARPRKRAKATAPPHTEGTPLCRP
jgi:hypothetical protein